MSQTAVSRDHDKAPSNAPRGYLERSELPLTSLVLILPLIVLYEVGTQFLTTAAQHGKNEQIIAFTMIQKFFGLFGATARHLPALAVVGVLLAWHIARRDDWLVDLKVLMGMCIECLVLTVPLIVMAQVLARYFPLSASEGPTGDTIIMSFGAGVYEEFFFRLALFTLLSLFFCDLLRLQKRFAYLLIVVISSMLFSLYHYLSPSEHFQWQTFAFRTMAGLYFGVLFAFRGFGISAVSHSLYDIIITLL